MDAITALTLLNQLLAQTMALGKLIETAQSEGRDITPQELDGLAQYDTQVRTLLQESIARAQSEGR